MPGRRPKPTALHKLEGTYNPTKHGRDRQSEPVVEGDLRITPSRLTPEQRAIWRYALLHAPKHVLKKIDRDVLLLWVTTKSRHNEAQRLLDAEQHGAIWAKSPLHRIVDKTTVLLVRLASELGFSPASRPRLHVELPSAAENDEDDPWGELRLVQGGKPE